MARIIQVTVSPKGDVTVQTKGYVGSECQQASKFIERALGIVSTEVKTGEFFQSQSQQQQVQE